MSILLQLGERAYEATHTALKERAFRLGQLLDYAESKLAGQFHSQKSREWYQGELTQLRTEAFEVDKLLLVMETERQWQDRK